MWIWFTLGFVTFVLLVVGIPLLLHDTGLIRIRRKMMRGEQLTEEERDRLWNK